MQRISHTDKEITEAANQKIFSVEKGMLNGYLSLKEVGDLLPSSIIVQDLQALEVVYMNQYGCDNIKHSMEEINSMGLKYYDKFLHPNETAAILPKTIEFCKRGDHTELYSFFQRVRTGKNGSFDWYYTVCKFLNTKGESANKILLISNRVEGTGHMVKKVQNLLEENDFVVKNYRKFALLTKREKEIITMVTEGNSTKDISELLSVSHHTVSTHRKNIGVKLEIKSLGDLLKFAAAFELIKK